MRRAIDAFGGAVKSARFQPRVSRAGDRRLPDSTPQGAQEVVMKALVKDDERFAQTRAGFHLAAFVCLMLQRAPAFMI